MAAIRVHLADDHTMFREGLEAILASSEDLEVVGRSSTGGEATAMIAETKPDLVITQLDANLKAVEEILSGCARASLRTPRLVVLTVFDDPRYLKALSEVGIDAYVHKSSSSVEFLATIEALSLSGRRTERGGLDAPRSCGADWTKSRRGGALGEGDARSWCLRPAASRTSR